MLENVKLINSVLLSFLLLAGLILVCLMIFWMPKLAQSEIDLNKAKCLESYHNQNQPPLGACGSFLNE